MSESKSNHYVDVYQSVEEKAKYVGYGEEATRALVHPASSHNNELMQWLSTSKYSFSISAPTQNENKVHMNTSCQHVSNLSGSLWRMDVRTLWH